MARLHLILKALRELGPRQLGLYAWYQVLLRSGFLRWWTRVRGRKTGAASHRSSVIRPVLSLPSPHEIKDILGDSGITEITKSANEIVEGKFRRFGEKPVPIELTPPGVLTHWIDYELGRVSWGAADPKFIWEPARFGWVFSLGQAYLITEDERYPEVFWQNYENFISANPLNQGPNWTSAQEVALRVLAFVFAGQLFAKSPHSTSLRTSSLAKSIADHAERIPPSILYARAQNNNHLLSEAAGLITAGLAYPAHPKSEQWQRLGWKWFVRGIQNQVADDGSYSQHSTNYHRLMLQLALWVSALKGDSISKLKAIIPKLQFATQWLLQLTDSKSGRVPNLGPNDGAFILSLTSLPFTDYRPVLQAASKAFLNEPAFESGPWDDLSLWFHTKHVSLSTDPRPLTTQPLILSEKNSNSWAYLRAAQFDGRPGHADQLHLDLWWRGMNTARDAGTYLYNADPPWDNRLISAAVHNTVTLNGQDQMTRAGRFLYLDKAQAQILAEERTDDGSLKLVSAQHDGYRRFGAIHKRTVIAQDDGLWIVEDDIIPADGQKLEVTHEARLHWLLPDWQYDFQEEDGQLQIFSPDGWIILSVSGNPFSARYMLVRAGEILFGDNQQIHPAWGWYSPTYAAKKPALSFSVTVKSSLPIRFRSEWRFPK